MPNSSTNERITRGVELVNDRRRYTGFKFLGCDTTVLVDIAVAITDILPSVVRSPL